MKSRAATLCFVSVFVCSSTAHLYGRAKVNLVAEYNQDGPKVVTELSIPQMRQNHNEPADRRRVNRQAKIRRNSCREVVTTLWRSVASAE